MIDRELLLERLERLERFAIVLDELMPRSAELVRDAITMLKEQEAKPVKIVKNVYNHEFYYCPRCDRSFYELYVKPKFCDKCGQAVKWQ